MENSKASDTPVYPKAVNHVGVGVADIERAIRWYQEVLGFTLLMGRPTSTGCVTVKNPLATSSKSTHTITRRCTAG